MLRVYHSNRLDVLEALMEFIVERERLDDPFEPEMILVQSTGMAQWLQMTLSQKFGIAANIDFPLPAFLPYMDRPADTKAGCKHRCTDAALRYFKSEVMGMPGLGVLPPAVLGRAHPHGVVRPLRLGAPARGSAAPAPA